MKKEKSKKHRFSGIISQLYVVIIIGLLTVMTVSYISQRHVAHRDVAEDYYELANSVSQETIEVLKQFPAWRWLLSYWYNHADIMDPEYDVDFVTGTRTRTQRVRLSEKYPGFNMQYATEEELEKLEEEDQQRYAEIAYSWLITRVNQICSSYKVDYLYCVATDMETEEAYSSQFYIFSAAAPGSVRGTELYNAYPLGKVSEVSSDTQEMMRKAAMEANNDYLSQKVKKKAFDDTGNYMDMYTWVDKIDGNAFLIGISFSLVEARKQAGLLTRQGVTLSVLAMFLLLNIILIEVFLLVINPVRGVQKAVRNYTKDKNSKEVENSVLSIFAGRKGKGIRSNEIGELSEDLVLMSKEMDEYVEQIQTITAEKDRIEVELNLAARIQQEMLPPADPVFDRSDFELCALMDPAREVGGDFYDYFMIDADHIALVIADVSGKGVPAAMFMTVSRTLIKTQTQYSRSPAEIFYAVNNQLCEDNKTALFVTVWMAIVELSTGNVVESNAGHEHPAICRAGGRFELVKQKHSPMLGGFPDLGFRDNTYKLNPGDQIFVYTDGVPEANDPQEKLFGTARMLDALNRNPDAPQKEQLKGLRESIREYADGAEQFDDITMLLFRYNGN